MKVLLFDKDVYDHYVKGYSDIIKDAGLTMAYVPPKDLKYDEQVEVIISGRVKADNLLYLPNLKMVIVPYTGLNGLDLPALEAAGVEVMNTSAHGRFVAERAVAMMLAQRGRLINFHNALKEQYWSKRYEDDREAWKTSYDKKVAIYGYGTIGQEVGRLIRSFNPKIGVLSYKDREFVDVSTFEDLKALCHWCDVLFITAPLTLDTKNSLNDEILKGMTGVSIINVGRGGIIDEKAIYQRLKDGTIGGFSSDVWYQYPNKEQPNCWPSKYPFQELDNVVMTPHNAGFEETSMSVRYEDVLHKVINFSKKGCVE